MAIQDEDKNNASGAQAHQVFGDDAGGLSSFHAGGMFGAPISRGLGSDVYNKLKKGLQERYAEAQPGVVIALLDLDNTNNTALDFSNLIVALQLKDAPQMGVAYHILTLEATGEKLPSYLENINGANVEVMRAVSDSIEGTLLNLADARVRAAFPNVSTVIYVDSTIVPATFNVEDKTALHNLAMNAGLACATELQLRKDTFRDLNLARMKNEGQLTTNLQFGRSTFENAVGLPVRSDIVVSFTSRKNGGQQGRQAQANSGDKEVCITKVSGFIDLVYTPRNPQSAFGGQWMMPQQQQQMGINPMMTQSYAARLVLTNLISDFAYTPSAVLLAMATALTVSDNNNWYQAYRPTPSMGNKTGQDLNDIGALNIDANISQEPGGFGTRINTKGEEFGLPQLGQLLNMTVQPGMMLAIDVPEAGPQSWYLSVFASAANGKPAAYDAIYNAANDLTDGASAVTSRPARPCSRTRATASTWATGRTAPAPSATCVTSITWPCATCWARPTRSPSATGATRSCVRNSRRCNVWLRASA
jgi:hypothetical protein